MAYTTIDDPSAYFQIATWTGDGSSPRTITNDGNSNLQPDWVWHKNRSDSGRSHYLHDSSRGFGAQKELTTNNDHVEDSDSHLTENHGFIASASTDSFVLGAGATNDNYTNNNSSTYVAWQWKANGGTTTSNGASGDIKASVTQREDTAKFAMCTYTGTGINAGQSHRVNHGLGTTPHVMLFKSRGAAGDWVVYHHKNTDAPETDYLVLNEGNATADSANKFNDTAPNTSYATIGGDDNISSGTMMLYSFAEVQGYSKFGRYNGNGNTDGPFIYTGFQPAWIMTKRTDNTGSWLIHDNERNGLNPDNDELEVNTNSQEVSNDRLDIVSNGFKIRNSAGYVNTSNATYVYMAFAKHPFVSSEGVPTTTR